MEVKIGVKGAARELVLESEQTPDDVVAAVKAALADDDGMLDLTDDHGRRVLVPTEKVAFVEIGSPERGRVGFGAL
ncbi:MAG: DUF3107 domain-containing protein [Candidatus Nanopelagicales bacterium]